MHVVNTNVSIYIFFDIKGTISDVVAYCLWLFEGSFECKKIIPVYFL